MDHHYVFMLNGEEVYRLSGGPKPPVGTTVIEEHPPVVIKKLGLIAHPPFKVLTPQQMAKLSAAHKTETIIQLELDQTSPI